MVEPYKPLYTVKEVAKILHMGINDTYSLIRSGQIKCLRLGNMKVRGTDLEAFINNYPEICPDEVQPDNESA